MWRWHTRFLQQEIASIRKKRASAPTSPVPRRPPDNFVLRIIGRARDVTMVEKLCLGIMTNMNDVCKLTESVANVK
jgi:hypothetical protein